MKKKPSIVDPIIHTAHRLEAIANKYVYTPLGISPVSIAILSILEMHARLTPSDILALLSCTKSNVSQRLNFLEKKGYIKRRYASVGGDKRKVIISITAPGKTHLQEMHARLEKAKICLEEKFSSTEIAHHLAFFEKLSRHLDVGEHELEILFKK